MALEARLRQLEKATGINEPCPVCEIMEEWGVRIGAECEAAGGTCRDYPFVPFAEFCPYCARERVTNAGAFTEGEREVMRRYDAAFREGTVCALDKAGVDAEIAAMFERRGQEVYGAFYDRWRELREEQERAVDEVARRVAPRYHYLCRVAGCACEYPKTEYQWVENSRANGYAVK